MPIAEEQPEEEIESTLRKMVEQIEVGCQCRGECSSKQVSLLLHFARLSMSTPETPPHRISCVL